MRRVRLVLVSSSRPILPRRSSSQTCRPKMSSRPGGRASRAVATSSMGGWASSRSAPSSKTMKSSSLSLVTSRRPHEPIRTIVAAASMSSATSRSLRSSSLRSVSPRAEAIRSKPVPVATSSRATPSAPFTAQDVAAPAGTSRVPLTSDAHRCGGRASRIHGTSRQRSSAGVKSASSSAVSGTCRPSRSELT